MKLKNKDLRLGKIKGKVSKTIEKFEKKQFIKRIWEKDPTVWKKSNDHASSILNRLGWLSLPYTMTNNVYEINEFTKDIIKEGFTTAVLLGMGGSSMGPEVISKVFGSDAGYMTLHVLDTTDPEAIMRVSNELDISKTLFIVSSKSGSTIEVDSLFRYFYEKVSSSNSESPGSQFIAITDKDTQLQETALAKGFRKVFTNPSDIGGRYSVLSYFGLVPAALIGVDLIEFLRNAGNMMNLCSNLQCDKNPGALIGIIAGIAAEDGRDKLTFFYSNELKSLGSWVEQLIAESTGKEKKGILPVEGEKPGSPKEYSADRIFVSTTLSASEKLKKTVAVLARKKFPVINISLNDKYDLAGQFYLWEFATSVMGAMLKINPFDEPNVKESKDNTSVALASYETSGELVVPEETCSDGALTATLSVGGSRVKIKKSGKLGVEDIIEGFMLLADDKDYFAIMAYIDPSAGNLKKLNKIRELIRKREKSAVTVGFGPRFLHSTGQYHKGGPNSGMFIQIVSDADNDITIPERKYSFNVLKNAQALGDYESLLRRKRRVLRINLGKDTDKGLDMLYKYFNKIS